MIEPVNKLNWQDVLTIWRYVFIVYASSCLYNFLKFGFIVIVVVLFLRLLHVIPS